MKQITDKVKYCKIEAVADSPKASDTLVGLITSWLKNLQITNLSV